MELSLLTNALMQFTEPRILLFAVAGMVIGIIIGALPGASATMGITLMLPISFTLGPEAAIVLLIAVYCGGIFGGSIPAVLLKIPGTPASAATIFDGYPMTQQGEASKALLLTVYASTFGGIISGIILMIGAPILAMIALKFGPPETLALSLFGLSIVASLASGNLLKGLIMAVFGLFIATFGADPQFGAPRYTFGNMNLFEGIPLIPVLIGVFSIPEALTMMINDTENIEKISKIKKKFYLKWSEFSSLIPTMFKSGVIGSILGITPAVGPEVATFIGYNEAKRASKDKGKFGKGAPEGVVASESANNGVTGASLVPTLTLGIPGSAAAAAVMGGLMIQGIRPGPALFGNDPQFVWFILVSFLLLQVVLFFAGSIIVNLSQYVLKVPSFFLGPCIIVLSVVGAYAINNNSFSILVMCISGVLAFILNRYGFSPVPFILALILGPQIEGELNRTILISGEGASNLFLYLMTRPIALLFFVLAFITFFVPIFSARAKK